MPSVGSGGISFGNIVTPIECEMTNGYGTAPSSGTITFREQPSINRVGDLVLDCDGNVRRWTNCLIGNFQQSLSTSQGPFVTAQILDRRWAWQDATISGLYNVLKPSGGIDTRTEKTPQELAKLLFEALGEKRPDLTALPNTARPPIDWDYANVANELAGLCDSLNCRVVLGSNDTPRIVRRGVGRGLQDTPYTFAAGRAVDALPPPDYLVVLGAPKEYQVELKLEAVGREVDGQWLPIDDLSYQPGTGWGKEYPPTFGGVEDKEIRTADGRLVRPLQLAQASVYRTFRIKADGISVSKDRTGLKREQIVLTDTLVETYTDETGVDRRFPAYVKGEWCSISRPDGKNSAADATVVTYSQTTGATETAQVSIDPATWTVTVPEHLFKISANGTDIEAPVLRLVTTVYVRDEKTRGIERYEREKRISRGPVRGAGRKAFLPHEDCVLQTTTDYDKYGRINSSKVKDEKDLEKRADYYIEVAQQSYLTSSQMQMSQKGIDLIEVDGLVEQVAWRIDTNGGPETVASQGYQANRVYPDYDEQRRRQQRYAAEQDAAKKAKK